MAVWENTERKVWEPPKEEVKKSPFPLKPGESFNFKENGSGYNPNPEVPYVPQGMGAVGNDLWEMLKNAPMEALQSIPGLFKGANEALYQATTNAPRATANVLGAGPLEMTKQAYNLGPRALEYLGEKGLVPQSLQYGAARAKIGNTGLKEKLFGPEQPGDPFLEGLAPYIALKRPLASSPAITTGAITELQEGNPFAGALLGKAAQKTGQAIGGIKNEIQNRRELNKLRNEGITYGDELNTLNETLPTYEESVKTASEQAAQTAQELQKAEELQQEATAHHPSEFERLQDEKFALQEQGLEAEQQTFAKQQEIAQQELAQQQQALAQQQEQAQKAQEAQTALEEIKYETGHASSRALNNKIKSNQQALEELNQQIALSPDVAHLPQAEKILSESEKQLSESEKKLASNEYKLNRMLGEGSAHNARIAKIIYEKQNAIEEGISKEYNDIGEASKGYNIPLNENPELIQLEKDLREMAPNATDAEFSKLFERASKQLGITPEKSVPAKEYLQKYRSKRNEGFNLIRQSNDKGGSSTVEGKMLRDAGQKALDEADNMLATYQKYVPEDISKRLLAANEEFRTKVAPLKKSSTWYAIENNKKIPGKDLIEKFLGESPDLEIMRGHILSDPIASELMLGSRIAGKPDKWNDYHEASIPYLENVSPETIKLFQEHAQLNEAIPKIKETAKKSQETIKELTPAKNQIEANQKKIDSTMKELEKWKSELAELKKAEKEAKEAKKAAKVEMKDFSAEKAKIAHEAKQEKLNRAKQIKGVEKQAKTLKQVEAEHKAETARKKQAHQRTKEQLSKAEKAHNEHLKRIKEEEAKVKKADEERAKKIKEVEEKIKINKDKLFNLVKKGTQAVGLSSIMKMLIG